MPQDNYAHRSYIKDVYVELPDYSFNHSPLYNKGEKKTEKWFLGRNQITDRFLNILLHSHTNNSGSYLVTGYRGMGKTSFVKKVIQDYKEIQKNDFNIYPIDISFAQSNLNETDILKQITNNLISISESKPSIQFWSNFTPLNIFKVLALIFSLSFYIYFLFIYRYEPNIGVELMPLDKKNTTKSEVAKDSNVVNKISVTSKRVGDRSLVKIVKEKFQTQNVINPLSLFLENQRNIIKDTFNSKTDNKITLLGYYTILLLLFSVTLTYTILSLKKVFFIVIYSSREKWADILGDEKKLYDAIKGSYKEHKVLKKLRLLHERSNASVTDEDGVQSVSEQLPLGFIQRKLKKYEIKNSKEIENELIEILREYSTIKNKPIKFIIIFDELDKVEPNVGKGFYHEDLQASDQSEFNRIKANEIRNRKKLIVNILGSLKYFITTAEAKFVFIAGREMFDAALADIADRESFISSIFHHVIYVDSFLKDSSGTKAKGITGVVDSYLGKILIPTSYTDSQDKDELFLKRYYNYLKSGEVKKLNEQEVLKVIYTLQNFIIYLTYRSNGSPKKVVKLLEEHISSYGGKIDSPLRIVAERIPESGAICEHKGPSSHRTLFLALTYKHQYRFGFISYIFRPFVMSQSQVIRKYSDTVLVSTQYLMDHILKFHSFAFSVENLELIPEVITNNKNPLFRKYIKEIIQFLRNGHIRETELGLFDYKFTNATSNEIAYLSRVFEDESAALNFSLDETYNVKQYILNKIKTLKNSYHNISQDSTQRNDNSITFLYTVLGDTQYFDQEYDDAVVSYQEALQYITLTPYVHSPSTAISYLKLKLKLGLIFEKMKNDDRALASFNEAKQYINSIVKSDVIYTELLQLFSLVYSASIYLQEKYTVEGICKPLFERDSNEFISFIKNRRDNEVSSRIVTADHYNDIANLLYYKNYVSEIPYAKGLLKHLILGNITTISNTADSDKLYLINKDFRASLDAYLYYVTALTTLFNTKNASFSDLAMMGSEKIRFFENIHNKAYLKIVAFNFSNIGNFLFSLIENNNLGCSSKLKQYISIWNERESIVAFLRDKSFDSKSNSKAKESFYENLRNEIGATFASKSEIVEFLRKELSNKGIELKLKQLKSIDRPMVFWDIITHNYFGDVNDQEGDALEVILFSYYLSARFYYKIGKTASFCFQLRKILQAIRSVLSFDDDTRKFNGLLIKFLEETLFSMIIEGINLNSSSTDRPQNDKFKYIIGLEEKENKEIYTKYNYMNLSNSSELKEAVLFIADLKVRNLNIGVKELKNLEKIEEAIPELSLITPYNSISSQFVRIQELDLQEKINTILLNKFLKKDLQTRWEKKHFYELSEIKKDEDYPCFLIKLKKHCDVLNEGENFKEYVEIVANSISTLSQVINILKIYQVNPYLSYSYFGNFHRKMGRWLKHYELIKVFEKQNLGLSVKSKVSIDSLLKSTLGAEAMITLDSTSQSQLALLYYHKAKQVHSNGMAYHQEMNNFVFLEGDYDDNLYHFGVALERQKINSYQVRTRIKELELELKSSPFYKYDSYANSSMFE